MSSKTLAGGATAAAALLLGLALSARALALSRRHLVPIFDEVAYLDQARGFARLGGAAAVVQCYWQGRCREDNRHPLYGLLISPAIRVRAGDFAKAKLATLACAWVLIGAAFWAGWRRAGPGAALLAAALAALSPTLAYLSSRVLADVLFAALYVTALEILIAFEGSRWGWLGFGMLSGLAYLSKGTGHLLLLAGAALAWRRRGARAVVSAEAWLAAAGFMFVAGFLLRRNSLLWGEPFHNFNAKVFWLDD